MNPESPPIADPHSTAHQELHKEAIKNKIYLLAMMVFAGIGAQLCITAMDEYAIPNAPTRFWLGPVIIAVVCFLASLAFCIGLWRIAKRIQHLVKAPS